MLWKCCTQYACKFEKLSSGHRTGKDQFHFNHKERQCQKMFKLQHNCTHLTNSKVMLKILQVRLQQYVNQELQNGFQAGFRKGRGTRHQIANMLDHRKRKRVPEKNLLLLYWLPQSLWLCGSQQTGKFLKTWEYKTTLSVSWEICMQVKKQQLELDMDQKTGSKSGKFAIIYN